MVMSIIWKICFIFINIISKSKIS